VREFQARRKLIKEGLTDATRGLLSGPAGSTVGSGIPTIYNGSDLKKLRKKFRKAKY